MILTQRVLYGSSLYAVICAVLMLARPGFAFAPSGQPRPFGITDPDASVFSVGVIAHVAAVFSYLAACAKT